MSGAEGDGGAGLERLVHRVAGVEVGERTAFAGGRLTVGADEVGALFADEALASVRVSAVSPGDSARIVKVLDAVQPRSKAGAGSGIFPGLLGPPSTQGRGSTRILDGAAVVTAGHLPRAQEALADMSGPAAPLSFLGGTHNVVVEFERAGDAPWEAVASALRRGCLQLAAALAESASGAECDEIETVPAVRADGHGELPRVGAITNLQTQGAFKDVLVYGDSFARALPTPFDPNELEDGAVVSAQYGHPGLKNPTFLHQNHPLVAALRARDGVDLRFAGLVLSPEPVDQARKELISAYAARLCASLGWDGALITKEGGGNADSDIALKMDALEDLGVSAVGLFAEMSGPDGSGPPLVSPPQRATAMVSTGNYDERLQLPAVDRALGGEVFEVASAGAAEAMEVPVAVVYASLSPLGWGRLTAAVPS